MVIDGVKKGSEAAKDIETLMECISAFLEILSIHISRRSATYAPPQLVNTCDLVLKHFLVVLKQVYSQTHSQRERAKVAFKAFLGEQVNQDYLKEMETLIKNFSNSSIAAILAKVGDQSHHLGEIREGVGKLVDGQTLKDIEARLAVSGISKENESYRELGEATRGRSYD